MRRETPLLIAIFLDLVGFGMAFPDIQIRAEHLQAPGWMIGGILSSLFLVQLIASPRWGAFSDRIGRKPVAIVCTLLSALSMLVYALTTNLVGILASRIIAGLAAANVVVAQAYLADVNTEKDRPRAMGRIGAAISAGLISGPAIGGWLAQIGGSHLLGLTAASFSLIGAILLALGMPKPDSSHPSSESHSSPQNAVPSQKTGPKPKHRMLDLRLLKDIPELRRMFLLAAVAWFALACLEGTFGRLLEHNLHFPFAILGLDFKVPQSASGLIFGMESLIAALTQAFLYGWLSLRLSPTALLRVGYLLQGLGLLLTPLVPSLGLIAIFSAIYSFGGGVANPTVNASCSSLAPADRQGELFGLLQGARSIGFLVGPLLGGMLFDLRPAAPYILAGAVAAAAAFIVPQNLRALPS